jgi:hypothetical protein
MVDLCQEINNCDDVGERKQSRRNTAFSIYLRKQPSIPSLMWVIVYYIRR